MHMCVVGDHASACSHVHFNLQCITSAQGFYVSLQDEGGGHLIGFGQAEKVLKLLDAIQCLKVNSLIGIR